MVGARYLTGVAAAVVALATCAGAGAGNSWTLRISFMPDRVYQGLPAAVSVLVKPDNTRCTLAVRYADGTTQQGLKPLRAASGRAAWTWTMAQFAPAGPARVSVACGRSGSVRRTFTVVGGTVAHSKLSIVKQGYSQRNDTYDHGSSVSYGVLVDNPSASQDAENVTVLVNFVDANDHVLQSATTRVPTIAAGATFNLGGNATLPSQTPVAKLEVVVQTESFAAHDLHIPAIENVQIVGSQFDPGWVGEVDGALVNDDLTRDLTSAQLSIVLFDAAGNVVGGGTGFLLASLPPGTRAYFSAGTGFSSVAVDHASVAAISIEPSYHAP